ncbi:MAG: Gfo/Idh/MocA family oxidoreductase [Oligoflexia bacterium]|nr:Gfo/Idh/MocA family oxidoreductase [Oligoflexia bacterium]
MIKAGVIGVGYLGRFHAQKYRDIDTVELAGVYDSNTDRAREIAAECGCDFFTDVDELLEKTDLLSIATPAATHYEVALRALKAGKHCLVEKPFTRTLQEARDLMKVADSKGLVIQIGHLERFNTVTSRSYSLIKEPRFAECHRLAQFTARSTDIDVILDLMIHDIDLVLAVFGDKITEVDAAGVPVLTDKIDIAHAKLVFDNGAMVNLTASRISNKAVRKMRIFQRYSYIGLDYQKGEIEVFERLGGEGNYRINGRVLPLGTTDAIRAEIISFIDCVENNKKPVVGAENALKALEVAQRVISGIEKRMDLI